MFGILVSCNNYILKSETESVDHNDDSSKDKFMLKAF